MKERFTILMMVALAVGVSAPTAQAALQLRLSELGFAPLTITDQQAGVDENATVGVIQYSKGYGTFDVNLQLGISKPLIGGPTVAALDLTDADLENTSTGTRTLTVQLTDTDFSLPALVGTQGVLTSNIGGTILGTGTVGLTQIFDPDNQPFGSPGNDVSLPLGPFNTPTFSGTASTSVPISVLFSLTEVATITLAPGSLTTFDANSVVPVPAAFLLGLLGLGAAGLGLRRKVS